MKLKSSTDVRSRALTNQQRSSSNKSLIASNTSLGVLAPSDGSPSIGSDMSQASSVRPSSVKAPSSDDVMRRISYITDPEGDRDYFDRFIELSKVVKFESVTPNFDGTLPLKYFPYTKHVVFVDSAHTCDTPGNVSSRINETMFVCGGDIWDKGAGDLYITRQLLSMQNRYGEHRVHFIIGNRDANKIRILQEIGTGDGNFTGEKNMPHPHHGVYWLKGTGLTGDPDLINILASERANSVSSSSTPSSKSLRSSHGTVPPSAAARLTWILQHSMGCPDAFEFRRGELKREKVSCARALMDTTDKSDTDSGKEIESDSETEFIVTDEEIVQSYRSSCHPTKGVMGQYLRKGKLALRFGGVLFLHGALPISPEILLEYKAHKAQLVDNLSTQARSKSEETSSFWAKFYRSVMPWLPALSDDDDRHLSLCSHAIEGLTLRNFGTIGSNRSVFSDLSDTFVSPLSHNENVSDNVAPANIRRSAPDQRSFWCKILGFASHGYSDSLGIMSLCHKLCHSLLTCRCKCRMRQIPNKRRAGNKPEHMNRDGNSSDLNTKEYEESKKRISKIEGSFCSSNSGDDLTEHVDCRISFSKYDDKVRRISQLRASLNPPNENENENEYAYEDEQLEGLCETNTRSRVTFAALKSIVKPDEKPNYERRHTMSLEEERLLVKEEEDTPVHNVDEWIDRLNKFSKENCEAWVKYVTANPNGDYCWSRFGGYDGNFGSMVQLSMGWLPNKDVNHSVVYSTWITDGMPQMVCGKTELDRLHAELLGDFFNASGLDLIVTGHQPIGDSPLTIQVESKDSMKPKFIIVGDTSYSGDTKWVGKLKNKGRGKALSARGDVAVTEILIDQCAQGDVVGATYHGILSDGLEYKSNNLYNSHKDSSMVGKLVNRNLIIEDAEVENEVDQIDWIIKAQLSDGSFLIQSGKGHQVFNARAKKVACAI